MDTFLRLKDHARHGSPTTTCSLLLWLGAPWVISIVQAIAQFMLSQADHGIVNKGVCFIPDKNFLILGTLFSFIIPAVISIVFYGLCFHEIRGLRRGKYLEETSETSTQNIYNSHYGSHESLNDESENDLSDTTSCVSDTLENQHHHVYQKAEQVQLAVVTSVNENEDSNKQQEASFCQIDAELENGGGKHNLAFADHLLSTDQSSSCTLLLRDGSHAEGDLLRDGTEDDHTCFEESLRTEIILNRLMFLLLLGSITAWIPYSVSNIVYSVCDSCRDNMTFPEMMTFKWLAYASAMVGPFVYAKYSPHIREGYWNTLTCKLCPCSR